MNKFDTIIVGQGLAGSLLAYHWISKGKRVFVVDDEPKISSSKLAAGKYNPIVFKRLNKSWKIDQLLPVLFDFYMSIERDCQHEILHQKDLMIKLFANDQQVKDWEKRQEESDYNKYLGGNEEVELPDWIADTTSGYAKVLNSGWVDIKQMIALIRNYIQESGSVYQKQIFDYSKIKFDEEKVVYQDTIVAQDIIFSEGYKVRENPYFSYLPFSLTKGEVLTIEAKGLKLNHIVSKGFFVKPLGNDQYKIGATFNWKDKTEVPTGEAQIQLKEKFEKLYKGKYKVVNQEAGIRPTVIDRRPIVGEHPEQRHCYIFNGLGTKGVMLAPYFVKELFNFIYNNGNLDTEVDINRFTEKYYSKIEH